MHMDCLFCSYDKFELVGENELSFAIRDKYPVTELHTLVISKKHYETVFELPSSGMASIFELAKKCSENIMQDDESVKGFNFGSNSGKVAGQQIMHVHFHLVPRRIGDKSPSAAMP